MTIRNISLFVVSICIAFLLAEAGVRVSDYVKGVSARPVVEKARLNRDFYIYDSELGWKKKPNTEGTLTTREYSVHESINSQGLRGPEYDFLKPRDEYRILVLGDSYVEGYSVEFENTFTEVLKKYLNASGKRAFEVINAGTAGYSTDQEQLYYRGEGRRYGPDLTILAFFDNDVWYNVQPRNARGDKPYYTLEGGELALRNVPVETLEEYPKGWEHPGRPLPSGSALAGLKRFLFRESRLYRRVEAGVKNVNILYRLAIASGLAETPDSSLLPNEFGVWRKNPDVDFKLAWEVTEKLILKIREEAASAGSDFLVLYIPPSPAVYPRVWSATKLKYGLSDREFSAGQPASELEAICRRNGIRLVDPTEAFRLRARELKKEGKTLYFSRDPHFNEEGHRLIGEILAENIKVGDSR
ncbi:MAG: SGNH/GDSL hydrolase family protein [bacterium]|nr:SGNH/GDSL hydrolase family protein [bacterium]